MGESRNLDISGGVFTGMYCISSAALGLSTMTSACEPPWNRRKVCFIRFHLNENFLAVDGAAEQVLPELPVAAHGIGIAVVFHIDAHPPPEPR